MLIILNNLRSRVKTNPRQSLAVPKKKDMKTVFIRFLQVVSNKHGFDLIYALADQYL
jgi:hypothetical protein